jgi:hypothetical protein
MTQIELENYLYKKQRNRRRIILMCAIVSFSLLILGIGMREATKEVRIIEYDFFYEREEYTYNNNWLALIFPSLIASIYLAVIYIVDLLFCRFEVIEKDGQYLTVYRNTLSTIVYLDGYEIGRIAPLSFEYVIEARLASGVKVTLSFPSRRGLLAFAHISFSDNTPSIEL